MSFESYLWSHFLSSEIWKGFTIRKFSKIEKYLTIFMSFLKFRKHKIMRSRKIHEIVIMEFREIY